MTDEVEVEYPIVSITGWTPDPDKTTYTAYITTYTKTEGQVIVSVDADVATDVAGNPNIAAEALTVDVDQPLFYFFADSVGPAGSALRPIVKSSALLTPTLVILVALMSIRMIVLMKTMSQW